MSQELEDWQLALLVEARRYDDPSLIEANAAEEYRDNTDLIEQSKDKEAPVVVEREDAQKLERAESLLEESQGVDDPIVLSESEKEELVEANEAVKDFLSDALKENHGLRDEVVSDMSALSMVNQFRDEEGESIELESLAQQPETGGAESEEETEANADSSDEDPIETLPAEKRNEVREKRDRANLMEDRTPKYAESLRSQICEILEVDSLEDVSESKLEAL